MRLMRACPVGLVWLSLLLLLAACGGGGDTPTASEIQSCLQQAGLSVTAPGPETPTVRNVGGIGVSPGQGSITPGNYAAAVFVFGSEADAVDEEETLHDFYADVVRHGDAVVAYNPNPASAFRSQVDGCLN